ncbi:GNAT family N-acetyltransferase [bacterium]|nr:GNAT family N-acetyltransferase [bacterium]
MNAGCESFRIRPAVFEDHEYLVEFNCLMAFETEEKSLDRAVVASGVKQVLHDSAKGFYIIVEVEGRPVGSLMVTTEWSDWRNGYFWWIQSVYIRPEFRRRGLFRSLYSFVRQQAQSTSDVCGLRLYVDRDNLNAQQTYRILGMHETDYRLYEEVF